MLRKLLILLLGHVAIGLSATAHAEICKIRQANGSYLFTNLPDRCPKGSQYRMSATAPVPSSYRQATAKLPPAPSPKGNITLASPYSEPAPSATAIPVTYSSVSSSHKIYTYRDRDGSIVFTDAPRRGAIEWQGRSQPINYVKFLPSMKINRSKYTELIASTAYKYNLDPDLLHAVIRVESAYNPSAMSSAGAVGLMQLMPGTAARYGVTNRHDPTQNVDGGANYLRDLLQMFNNNLTLAIAAYNAGENAVIKYNNSIPPYRETQNYVRQVLALYHRS